MGDLHQKRPFTFLTKTYRTEADLRNGKARDALRTGQRAHEIPKSSVETHMGPALGRRPRGGIWAKDWADTPAPVGTGHRESRE